jgi:hypothetical protein
LFCFVCYLDLSILGPVPKMRLSSISGEVAWNNTTTLQPPKGTQFPGLPSLRKTLSSKVI